MFLNKSLIIIPTKDRCIQIKKSLNRLKNLKVKAKNIIVIDSSKDSNYKKNRQVYLKHKINFSYSEPSISKQRNIGMKFAKKYKNIKYLFFLDDDIYIEKKSFFEMDKAIKIYKKKNLAAFCFNQIQKSKESLFERIKQTKFIKKLGLYHPKKGKILKSGFQTKINNLKSDLKTDWVPFAALVCKKEHFVNHYFDESFSKYSYLEDLDFSLTLKKKFIVVSKATCIHEKEIERTSFEFGMIEVINRYKIVNKHKLNKVSLYKMIILRMLLNFIFIFFKNLSFSKRFYGNIIGMFYMIFFN